MPKNINVPVVDIVIETDSDINEIKNTAYSLIQITKIISDFAQLNDVIFYCYCSDKPIKRAERKKYLSHQEYRSQLFCKMFEKSKNLDFINRIVIINDAQKGNHYIHLISKLENENIVNLISDSLQEFDK